MTRMHPKTRVALIPATLLLLALTYCNRETATSPGGSKTTPDAAMVGTLAARAIALAMAEPSVRSQVLGDMRDSPVSDHKLVLQEYFGKPGGARLLAAVQQAGIDANTLQHDLNDLGPIQFYVPNADQRSSWRGSPDVLVASFIPNAPSVAFGITGESQLVALAQGVMPDNIEALFILQWAEPMFRRWSGPTSATETIQARDESQIGSGRVIRDATGHTISTIDDTPAGSTRPGRSVTAGEPAGTYLTALANDRGVCDATCWETLEFQFRSTASDNPTQYVSATLTGISTSPGSLWQGWWQVHTSRVLFNVTMEVQVWETDGSSGDDPFYCLLAGPNCSPGVSNWPYLISGHQWAFLLCEDNPQGCDPLFPDLEVTFADRSAPVATTVAVAPGTATINKGLTQAFSATVRDQYGDVMAGKTATWASLSTGVATVASTGALTATATGVGGGQATIRATVDGVNGNATLTVLAPSTVTISPSPSSICLGGQTQFFSTVKDQAGNVWNGGTVSWSSSSGSATVTSTSSRNATGSGVSSGSATITASLDGASGTSNATILPCLPTPTSCTLEYIPAPHYLRIAWVNANSTASTEVEYMPSSSNWQAVTTAAPGVTQAFKVVGPGLYYARVRHVKAGFLPSAYCNTNAKTVP